jgi:hypothetical protein
MPTKVAGSNCGKRATGLVVEPRSGETRFAPPGAKRTGDLRDADEGRRVELWEAGDRSRTGDLQLGKLTLYQLSYARNPTPPGATP